MSDYNPSERWKLGLEDDQYTELINTICVKLNHLPKSSLTTSQCVEVSLKFLCEGVSFRDLARAENVEYSLMKFIITETCAAIRVALKSMLEPLSTAEWERNIQDFAWTFQFPNCIGYLDGLTLALKRNSKLSSNANSCTQGNERKRAVLYTLVDSKCRFIMIDYCREDKYGATFNTSTISSVLKNVEKNLPEARYLPGFSTRLPRVVLATSSFPIRTNILRPYSPESYDEYPDCANYNRRHELVGKCSSAALNMLERRFGVLQTVEAVKHKYMEDICYACCCLHNYILAAKGDAGHVNYMLADLMPSRLASDSSVSDIDGYNIRNTFRDLLRIYSDRERWCKVGTAGWTVQKINL